MNEAIFTKHQLFYVILGLMALAILAMGLLDMYLIALLCGGLLLITYVISVETLTIDDRSIKLDMPAFYWQLESARKMPLSDIAQLQIKPVLPSVYTVMIRLNDGQQIKVRMLKRAF
jgi:hypothetical protein